jgi:hypothetical protein
VALAGYSTHWQRTAAISQWHWRITAGSTTERLPALLLGSAGSLVLACLKGLFIGCAALLMQC